MTNLKRKPFLQPQNLQGHNNFRPIFLVGFPRSGTTLLDTILRSHSEIQVIEEKPCLAKVKHFLIEKGYTDPANDEVTEKILSEARNIYKKEFNYFVVKKDLSSVFIDKYPLNLLDAPLINKLYPDAKFILSIRHPMDTILSCWMQNFKLNPAMANMVDLDRIVEFYCIAMETFKICRSRHKLNVYEIRYEDLLESFYEEISTTLEFVNTKWEPQIESYTETAFKRERIRTPSYSQVREPIYYDAKYRWLKYKKYLDQYSDQVSVWINEFRYENH